MPKSNKPRPEWTGFVTCWQIGREPRTDQVGRIIEKATFSHLMIGSARRYGGKIDEPFYVICTKFWPHTGMGTSVINEQEILTSKGNPAQLLAFSKIKLAADVVGLMERDDDYMNPQVARGYRRHQGQERRPAGLRSRRRVRNEGLGSLHGGRVRADNRAPYGVVPA